MIDLRKIAQQLRLPADQLRFAADLLEQGYQPAFIARHRADEVGHLPGGVLWALKFAIERQHQLSVTHTEALKHLGEGVEIDDECRERLEQAETVVDIDVALRCFRARRTARQNGERSGQASQLLEKMIAQSSKVADLPAWVATEMASEPAQSEALLQQCSRLIASLLAGDTRLMERLRHAIQKKATLRVEALADSGSSTKEAQPQASTMDGQSTTSPASESSASDSPTSTSTPAVLVQPDADAAQDSAVDAWGQQDEDLVGDDQAETLLSEGDSPASDAVTAALASDAATSTEPPIALTFDGGSKKNREAKLSTGKRKGGAAAAKALSKLTPRQRRRRWLSSVLQPLKSLKKPLNRLTAYQLLMLSRGQRSQLIKLDLDYDKRMLVNLARDVFVSDGHPFLKWFGEACEQALDGGLLAKIEADALAEEDELAQQKLLEAATDQLRASLMQRPVKGHRILVIDTVGPSTSCIAIIDAHGKCLTTGEVVCSSQPAAVSQNVILLGELVHKYRVTLVALSNGPARRFLVHTVAELMKQSASGNLRWTMVDRGGAEAYAAGRLASAELPQLNRRFRAAVWLGRRLQDPLTELLKLDPSRLRLGSFQRELPQDPLKQIVTATLTDCLCVKGLDSRHASEQLFQYVPGVSGEVAHKLADIASKREFTTREDLVKAIDNWSDAGKRQALGFLRIFGSPQTLDGTLIHPDDYRLAMRLIENTDLAAPPAAPEGWMPPKVKAPKAAKTPAAESDAAASLETSEAATLEAATLEAGASPESAPTAEAEAAVPAAATTDEALQPEASSSAESATETVGGDVEPSDADSAAANTTSPQATVSEESGSAEPAVDSVPEYSEDVVVQQSSPSVAIDVEKLARGWQVGRAKLAWLAQCLASPFGDARDRRPPVPMLRSMPTLADLQPGMSVYAIVVGVAEFGAFVELGPDCGGLIHISRLSARYVEDPHQAVQIGDLIQAWVVSVDVDKKRVALTALSPEQQRRQAEAQRAEEQERAQAQARSPRGSSQGSGEGARGQRTGAPQGSRGPARGAGDGPGSGGPRGSGPRGGGPKRDRGPERSGGRARGGNRDGGQGSADSGRPVVVKSKKPSPPISEAMQKGQEPLRSFSDLMQFYELQRTEPGAPPTTVQTQPPAQTESTTPESASAPDENSSGQ